ncbi:MAG: STAS domain-containing protein [Acidobacteriota bacterium]
MQEGQLIVDVLTSSNEEVLTRWVSLQREARSPSSAVTEDKIRQQSAEFLTALTTAVKNGGAAGITGPVWTPVRELLNRISAERALRGFSPSETATFVFSLKQPLFEQVRRRVSAPDDMARETWAVNKLLDGLGLLTMEEYQKAREEVISRQRAEMLELSTPVVTLWKGVLALPLIGTLDSERTQVVMENLLQRIVETGSTIAILDITGVPTVDTLVAQHLLKTVSAARLMGAECMISGIRPQIAQTIVHLGIDLNTIVTKATLADAFAIALKRLGITVSGGNESPGGPDRQIAATGA